MVRTRAKIAAAGLLCAVAALAAAMIGCCDCPQPACPCKPAPVVKPKSPDKPCPDWPHRRGGPVGPAAAVDSRRPIVGGRTSPDGTTTVVFRDADIKWPANISSRGSGCCAFRALDYAARWQCVPELVGLPERMREAKIEGGGWPEKVDAMIQRFAPGTLYWQDTGKRLSILEAAVKSGRLPCVDYSGHDPHYHYGINHCVNVCAYDAKADWVAILDNNYPDLSEIVWMGVGEFESRWSGWCYGLLAQAPGHAEGEASEEEYMGQIDETGFLNFGLSRSHYIRGRSSILNARQASEQDILAAIGGEMVPARPEPAPRMSPVVTILHEIPTPAYWLVGGFGLVYLLRRK